MWHLRWRTLVRAGRMGYNIMSLDSDTTVLQDPYVHLVSFVWQSAAASCISGTVWQQGAWL